MKGIFFTSILFVLLTACGTKQNNNSEELINDTVITEIVEPKKVYGLIIDSFIVDHGEVEPNKNLSELLNQYGVDNSTIFKIAEKSVDIFDVRRFKAGNNYSVFMTNDSMQKLQYFVYEQNPVEYVVFDLSDSIDIYKGEKEVLLKEVEGNGIIESSLWNSMVANNLPPTLSLELSDIYAWTIDFFGLEKGDKYKVVYDEEYVDTLRVGVKNIKCAEFEHRGYKYYAIPFIQDSTLSFFDEEGNSLRKAFLKAPLKFSRISSRFSNSRLHPVLKIRRPHHGVDYAAPVGTPVVSIGDGIVIKKEYSGGAGYMVKIKHNGVYTTAYLHLSKYGENINVGAKVKQGQVIGYVGSSGLSTGPHLDFRVYKNGVPVDPLQVEAPPVEPIKEENKIAFNAVKDSVLTLLKKL